MRGTGEAPEVGDEEPGLKPCGAAPRNQAGVRIGLDLPAFKQEWSGEMPDVRPSRGFINVMKPDFHLHLKAGHVASWHEVEEGDEYRFYALNEAGQQTGLVVSGKKDAFR